MNGREKVFNPSKLPCILKSTKKFKRSPRFRVPHGWELHNDWVLFIWAAAKFAQGAWEEKNKA